MFQKQASFASCIIIKEISWSKENVCNRQLCLIRLYNSLEMLQDLLKCHVEFLMAPFMGLF